MSDLLGEMMLPSPIHQLHLPLLDKMGILLHVKRDDLIHPIVSGNKWRKLHLNIEFALANSISTIITFGGAFSNHIYALAGACQMTGLHCVGIIRGELYDNPTLKACKKMGMELIAVNRTAYRSKEADPSIAKIISTYPNHLLIPEGGSNQLGVEGVTSTWTEINSQLINMPTVVVTACGSGGTTAGLAIGAPDGTSILSILILKTDYLANEVNKLIGSREHVPIEYVLDYHHGGYGKFDYKLLQDIRHLSHATNIPLDQVYNGKALLGLMDMIANGRFERGTEILYLHTGGMQGSIV